MNAAAVALLDGWGPPSPTQWAELDQHSPEYPFAAAVLRRAEELRRERFKDFFDNLTAAVQVGVARAFGAKA